MQFDKELLEFWSKMESWGEHLAVRLDAEELEDIENKCKQIKAEYYDILNWRIQHCKKLLELGRSDLLYYALAQLYDNCNIDNSQEYLFKRPVRYYAIKSVRENRSYHKAWALLAKTYSWAALFADDKSITPDDVRIGVGPWEDDSQPIQEIKSYIKQDYELSKDQLKKIFLIEKGICCIKKAIAIKPKNRSYKYLLKSLYHQRNEEHKPGNLPRNIGSNYFNYP